MDHVILGMLKTKTVVLPCHALSFLSHADWIISLAKGRILEQGTYRGLLEAGGDFTQLMEEHASVKTPKAGEKGDAAAEAGTAEGAEKKPDDEIEKKEDDKSAQGGQGKDGKLMEVEERAKGTVERSVFAYYINQVGRHLVMWVLCLYIGGSLIRVFRDWWLSRWASFDLSVVIGYDEDTWSELDVTQYFIAFHAASGIAILLFTSTRTIIIQVRKRHFLRHLYIKCIILPRQARDEHRENSKKVPFSLRYCFAGWRRSKLPETRWQRRRRRNEHRCSSYRIPFAPPTVPYRRDTAMRL